MKYLFLYLAVGLTFNAYTQNEGHFYGGLESNSQWLQSDDALNFLAPEDQFRANNYLLLNYTLKDFTVGIQYESYLPSALLGYNPIYNENNGIANYYLNYKKDNLDITAGYFYEQFGSGLILRSWEDRQLGLNNALKGLNIKFNPTDYLGLNFVYGTQRNAFEESLGTIQGIDTELDLGNLMDFKDGSLTFGASYVGRTQDRGINDKIPSTVGAYGARLDFNFKSFFGGIEAITKDPDVIANEGMISSNKLYDGTAMLVNLGYARKGLGINTTFRRLENWSFYADRLAEGNIFNQQVINYVPGLTKQQDYLLTNIYVYNAQPRLIIESFDQRSGEVGMQTDLFYTFKKGTSLGGKYGTKLAANFSYWAGLDAEYNIENRWYEAKFIGSGSKLFRDINIEMKKRWSKKWRSVFTFQDIIVDKGIVQGGPLGIEKPIHATIGVIEGTRVLEGGKSIRMVLQHLWTKEDRKDWAAGVLEYNFNSRVAIYAADSWNYGDGDKIHYYNLGGSYSKNNARLGVNYGRQRGGLICVGGVCRFVPENTGLSMNLNISF
jgi:hypothetical protein